MRAWRLHDYGQPLRLEECALAQPGPGEARVRVAAASVNPIDWKLSAGLLRGVFEPQLPRVLGRDCAGTVDAVGPGVTEFAPGDEIAGVADMARDGTHAECCVLPAAQAARRPANVPPDAAAALGVAGVSAYIALVEVAKITSGVHLLVHAGAGGVGSLALQIGRQLGAEVSTTCSAANADYCRSLGAHHVIDYTAEDFATLRGFDAVLDTVGGAVHERSAAVLKPGGTLVWLAAAPFDAMPGRNDVRVVRADVRCTADRLATLLEWAARGTLRVPVETRIPFADAPRGYALSRTGHARGKIVILT
ncbi:MAG: NADP-dependent oxidoreductase [Betaproteobacteria bacterium]|nr:MAG: NADP-dependent oxidoreductase [Betaproteobacteria bacterium]